MDLLTVKETARLLRVSPITIRRYIASGRLPAERVGRGVRVRREAIEGFVTPISPPAGKLENGSDEDLVEICSPSSPEGSVFVPINDLLGESITKDDALWNIIGIGQSDEPTGSALDEDEDEDELPTMREVLGISIGIGRSGEPTNIAEHKDEYLADAFEAKG